MAYCELDPSVSARVAYSLVFFSKALQAIRPSCLSAAVTCTAFST